MGITIEDGKGTGKNAGVTDENKLETEAITSAGELHANKVHGESYTAGFSVTPTAVGDCFGYMTNNSDDNMIISTLMLRAATDETIQLKLGDTGTAIDGTDITPVNRNAGSGKSADVVAQQGVDITGLAGGAVVAGIFIKGGESSLQIPIASGIIIPKNKTVSFYVVTGAIAVMVGCSIYFHK